MIGGLCLLVSGVLPSVIQAEDSTREVRTGQAGFVSWAADGERSQALASSIAMTLHNAFVEAKSPTPIDKVTVMEDGKMFMRMTRAGIDTLHKEPERYVSFAKHFVKIGNQKWSKVSLSLQRREGDVMVHATNDTPDGKTHVEIKSLTKPSTPTGKPKPPYSETPAKQ